MIINLKVSVIVPVFNCEKYIKRCIESVLNQTYQYFELIIINDGSTDNTQFICENYTNNENVTIIYNEKNMGLSYARNKGLEECNGDVIYFLDSDDFIHKETLERLISIEIETNADIIVSDFIYVTSDYEISLMADDNKFKFLTANEAILNLYKDDHISRKFGTAWGKIFKKELFDFISFPIGKLWEDVFILYKLYEASDRIIEVNFVTYFYFHNPDSITHRPISIKNLDYIDALEERAIHFKAMNKYLYLMTIIKELNLYIQIYKQARIEGNKDIMRIIKSRYRKLFLKHFTIQSLIHFRYLIFLL